MSLKICCKNGMHISFLKKKKKKWQLICGNGIAEIEGKKIVAMNLWQWRCRNRREKENFVAIGLW